MQTENAAPSAAWFLVGPTAVGKTAVAQHVAERTGAAILSADAMLVYRGMDIGTAKPLPVERGPVRYFGIDLADPDEPFSTGAWLAAVRAELSGRAGPPDPPHARATRSASASSIGGSGPTPPEPPQLLRLRRLDGPALPDRAPRPGGLIVAGGTGLYVRALVHGLDAPAADPVRRQYWQERLAREGLEALRRELTARAPQVAAALADPENPRRVIRALEHLDAHGSLPDTWREAPKPRLIGLRLPRSALHARIAARVERMFANGFLDEVATLRDRFPAWTAASVTTGARASVRAAFQPAVGGDGAPPSSSHALSQATGGRTVAQSADTPATARSAIGYAEACDLLDKRITREQAIAQIVVRTRQLAKRQETWFRHQADVTWIEIAADEPAAAIAARVLAAWREHGPTPIRLS